MTIKNFKKLFKRLPNSIQVLSKKIYSGLSHYRKFFERVVLPYRIKAVQKRHCKLVRRIKQKEKIKVAFFVIHDSIWKYDEVYKLLVQENRFDPVIVVCPFTRYGDEIMFKDMLQTSSFFEEKGYNVICTYDEKTESWIDVKKSIKPDIVFFTNPHKLTKNIYYINNFTDTLTCYVQYSLHVSHLNESQYNQTFHNLVWKIFCETEIHLKLATKHAKNNGSNVICTGYPGTDIFLKNKEIEKNPWGKSEKRKKIIWSPHHTILENDSNLGYSNFLEFNQLFLEILGIYKDDIIVSFKPHPLLKVKLYNHKDWGKRKTENYYQFWEKNENSILNESEYIDLFLTSDAIINDSGSFLAEYLYINKPNLFMVRSSLVLNKFNEFGKKCLDVTYKSCNEEELINFIKEQVIKGKDPLKKEREKFISNYLIPPKNRTASENIVNYIKKELT